MSDTKVSALPQIVTYSANDIILIIDVSSTNVSKQASLKDFSTNALQNTVINGTFTASANSTFHGALTLIQSNTTVNATATFVQPFVVNSDRFQVANNFTPATANTDLGGVGYMCKDEDYFYIQTRPLTLKRIALESF